MAPIKSSIDSTARTSFSLSRTGMGRPYHVLDCDLPQRRAGLFTVSYTDDSGTATRVNLPDGETLIGRGANCQIHMNVANVSRQHARLRVEGSRCALSDAGSSFGTQVNGTP